MPFALVFTDAAEEALNDLRQDPKRLTKVLKCLGFLETNPRHPGLQTHEYVSMRGQNEEKVWEAYVENNTPSAWRVFFHYGPDRGEITIIAITPHP